MPKKGGDIHPTKTSKVKSKGGVHCSIVDNGTRDILHMDIKPEGVGGSKKPRTQNHPSIISKLNKNKWKK